MLACAWARAGMHCRSTAAVLRARGISTSGAQREGKGARLLKPDPALALRSMGLGKLLEAWVVYKACSQPRVISAAPRILKAAEAWGLSWLSNAVVRRTFYSWFCPGSSDEAVVRTLRSLREAGMGAIVEFSVEADIGEAGGAARTDAVADASIRNYMKSIRMAAQVPGTFVALKVTGLAGPEVLYRLSMPYMPMRSAFERADGDGDGKVNYRQFRDVLLPSMPGGSRVSSPSGVFSMVDTDNDGLADWVDIQMALGLDNPLARPLYLSAAPSSEYGATEADLEGYERLVSRTRTIVREASKSGTRVLVDAEHTYFQPMIDHVATLMQREFNPAAQAGKALVYNTYQMYRTDAPGRIACDYERSAREGWRFGAKLVRGAYMELERARAERLGYASPINPTIEATHARYDAQVRFFIEEIARAGAAAPALVVGSHNAESIEAALQLVARHRIDLSAEQVVFGQLLRMQDDVSYALAKMNIPIYKCICYGPLAEVMPFLVRRAQENSAVSKSIHKEADMVMAEIKARLAGRRARFAPPDVGGDAAGRSLFPKAK